MSKLKFRLLVWTLLMGFSIVVHSQDASKVSLVNAGGMYVSSSGTTNIYVLGGVRMINGSLPVSIVQQGITKLTGDFYQDCTGHVFKTDAAGIGTSTGTITFAGDAFDKQITTKTPSTFNRSGNYVAFPNVQIDMSKNLILPSRMTADMNKLVVTSGKTGKLLLKSANDGTTNPGRIYDASLRFPKRAGDTDNTTTQSTNAPAGKIIVEREITGYRGNTTATGVMFPFATPFYNTHRSGYFAGNWVRRPVADASHHTEYTYGDKLNPGTNVIASDQYVINPKELLVAGQAYLIKPLGTSEFAGLVNNYPEALMITGDGDPDYREYQKTLFQFDGSVYHLDKVDEQLNLMPIFNASVTGNASKFIRILIGNSYTSSLDLQKISTYMINHSLTFCRYIYIYLPHQKTYVPYDVVQHIWGAETPAALTSEHTIPGMGVFMLELDKVASTGTILIDRTFLTHGNSPHNLRSDEGFRDEVLFTLKSESYPQMEDLSAIGFRRGAEETYDDLDMRKSKGKVMDGPVIYTLSSDNEELASNSIPTGTKSVNLCIESNDTEPDRCTLYISRQESMKTEYLLLEDKATKSLINLYESEYYDFILNPGEAKDRFVVHFTLPDATDISEINVPALKMFYNKQLQTLEVRGLTAKDENSVLIISDLQGRILQKESLIKESHAVDYLSEGIYIAKVIGERNVVLKFAIERR